MLFARSLPSIFQQQLQDSLRPAKFAMPAKRVSFAAGLKAQGPMMKAGRTGDRMLIACARSWGSGRWVFEGPNLMLDRRATAETPLWQVQLAGNVKAFAFRILAVMKDALVKHPNPNVRSLKDVEEQLQVRLIVGTPAISGPSDPDGVGFVDWQPVIYATNLETALSLIHFVLDYKVQTNLLPGMPDLGLHVAGGGAPDPPAPWQTLGAGQSITLPSPFRVLPPKGRRHVLAQLEKDAAEEGQHDDDESPTGSDGAIYTLTFRGALYPFKDRFDDRDVPGSFVETDATGGNRDYARFLQFKSGDQEARQQVQAVLKDVLQGMPVYFINMAGDSDLVAAWLRRFPSIIQAESVADL
eukprot:Skav218160  [mRNA]  locus=scaffold5213:3018:4198:+ [translate_table: standard]